MCTLRPNVMPFYACIGMVCASFVFIGTEFTICESNSLDNEKNDTNDNNDDDDDDDDDTSSSSVISFKP